MASQLDEAWKDLGTYLIEENADDKVVAAVSRQILVGQELPLDVHENLTTWEGTAPFMTEIARIQQMLEFLEDGYNA